MRTEKRIALRLAAIGTMLVVPMFAFAAGGGGGGGGAPTGTGNTVLETCTQDVWSCSEWGTCGLNGQQSRECRKTVDCPTTESPPAPPTVRSCTPACTADEWTCGEWGPCVDGRQRRICTKSSDCPLVETPSPATDIACRLDCGNDIWACTAWSACASTGTRTRACAQRIDCEVPDQASPKPTERERCTFRRSSPPVAAPPPSVLPPSSARSSPPVIVPGLRCGNLPTIEARIRCRIGLDTEALERELAVQYLPEECRALPARGSALAQEIARRGCIDRYRNLRPCWAKPIGPERLACVRGVLGIIDLRADRQQCDAVAPSAGPPGDVPSFIGPSVTCLATVRAKAYPYITFRFYDLEERAEGLRELGAPMDLVVKFVVAAEQGKQDFNAARSKTERIAIIRRVQSEWRAFVAALPEQAKARARVEGVGSSY